MAKLTINKTIEVCDFCRSDGYLQECIVCGKMYCLNCQCIIAGCWVQPNVCKKCEDRDDVKAVCEKYAKKITPIVRKRNEALSELPAEGGRLTMFCEVGIRLAGEDATLN